VNKANVQAICVELWTAIYGKLHWGYGIEVEKADEAASAAVAEVKQVLEKG